MASNIQVVAPGFQPAPSHSEHDQWIYLQQLIDRGQNQDAVVLFLSILEQLRGNQDYKRIYSYAFQLIPYFSDQQRVVFNDILPQLIHQDFSDEYENLAREFEFWRLLDNKPDALDKRKDFFVKAIDKFLAQYISNSEHFIPRKVKKLYDYLDKLIPEMTEQNIQALRSHLRKFLAVTVDPQEQYRVSRQLALWHFKLAQGKSDGPRYTAYSEAIFYYSQAIRIAKNISKPLCKETHLLTSQLIGESYFCNPFFLDFENQIQTTFRTRDVKEIGRLLARIEDLRKFNLHSSFYELVNKFINQLSPSFSTEWRTPDINAKLEKGTASALAFSQVYATERYEAQLREIREYFTKFNSDFQAFTRISKAFIPSLIRSFQRFIFTKYQSLFRMFFDDAFLILGPLPCSFNLRAMGSLGREEPCPFSDCELFLIYEDSADACELKKREEYFTNLARFLSLQIESLGETGHERQEGVKFNCFAQILIKGLMWDGKEFENFIKTPATFAHLLTETFSGDPSTLEHIALKSSSLFFFGAFVEVSQDSALPLNSQEFTQEEQELIKKWSVDPQNLRCIPQKMAESSVYLDFQRELKEILDKDRSRLRHARMLAYLDYRVKEYHPIWNPLFNFPRDQVDLKEQFSSFLHNLLADLAAYWDIKATNTLDIIEALVASRKLTRSSGSLLQEAAATIYTLRLSLHLMAGEAQDVLTLQNGRVSLSGERIQREKDLEKCYWVILIPLYTALSSIFKKKKSEQEKGFEDLFAQPFDFDLIENVLPLAALDPSLWIPFVSRFVAYLIESHAPELVHEKNFRKLSEHLTTEPLREAYWIACKQRSQDSGLWIQKLEMIPNRAGFRYALKSQAEALRSTILGLSESPCESNAIEYVKITDLFAGERYLDRRMIEQLIDLNPDSLGHIKRIKGGYHNVSRAVDSAVDCHFKELPTDPLMEYAVHDFLFRLAGDLTPATQLVRLEVKIKPDKNSNGEENPRVYPVLISKTIPGETLAAQDLSKLTVKDIDWARWTWMLLGSILIRPGDGLLQNYILHQRKIYCIDNDSAFVEPVVKFFRSKIQFCSALFCLFQNEALDPDVLREFCKLDPSTILKDWIESVQNKEKTYLESKLFTAKELRKFYEKDEKNRSRTVVLMERQTLATLCLQFYQLQNYLSTMLKAKNPHVTCLHLLDQLISIHETAIETSIGEYISRNYRVGCQKFSVLKDQLAWITSRDRDQTYSSEQSRRLPTFEEIQNRTKLSHQEAKEVLYSTLLCRDLGNHLLGTIHNEGIVQVDFSMKNGDHPDTERQKGDLNLLNFLVNGNPANPSRLQAKLVSLSLTHCAALDFERLEPFLHSTLEHLDLRFCPKIIGSELIKIQQKCPKLKRLYLSGCSEIQSICSTKDSGESGPLSFKELEELEISDVEKLEIIKLHVPLLHSIIANRNANLSIVELETGKIPKWRFRECPEFVTQEKVFQKLAVQVLKFGILADLFFQVILLESVKNSLIVRARNDLKFRKDFLSMFVQLTANNMSDQAIENCTNVFLSIIEILDPSEQALLIRIFYRRALGFEEGKNFLQAFKWYCITAEQGHPEAQNNLGDCYTKGRWTNRNVIEAVLWYQKAADQGLATAQFNLGVCYENGRGVVKNEQEATVWYRKAAAQRLAIAQFNLGVCYANGRGVVKNEQEATAWYQRAADLKLATAQYHLAVCYQIGRGVPKDEQEAIAWYRKAADEGLADAQFTLGVCYENGRGVSKDENGALYWYQNAAMQNHAEAQFILGVCYENGRGIPKDELEAFAWYRKAAEQNHAEAQFTLGIRYENGQGVLKDEKEAITWYRKAAEKSHTEAMFCLGACYANGLGVTKDEKEAIMWYRKAGERGHTDAMFCLGAYYETGLGVPKDEREAITWYRKAAEKSHTEAMFCLGACYETGLGVTKDEKEAIMWYRKAEERGHTDAMFCLGACYENGLGVPKDENGALYWYQKAAENGHIEAIFCLGRCYENGLGVPKNGHEAITCYRRAAEKGHTEAVFRLRACYENGLRVPKDESEAIVWYRKAADEGLAAAQFYIGSCYVNGRGVTEDIQMAIFWYRKAAEQGFAAAQYFLGVYCEDGRGVSRDEKEAFKWYRKAAEQGHAQAQFTLGSQYLDGRGVSKDEKEAAIWYRKAADQGLAGAQYNLGVCYDYGRGVPKDENETVNWYRKAAEQKLPQAQFALGVCYDCGRGVTEDIHTAIFWYRKAAEQGFADAQYFLGAYYENGRGVPGNVNEAFKWYQKAAEQGHAKAQFKLGICYVNGWGTPRDEQAAIACYKQAAAQGHVGARDTLRSQRKGFLG